MLAQCSLLTLSLVCKQLDRKNVYEENINSDITVKMTAIHDFLLNSKCTCCYFL